MKPIKKSKQNIKTESFEVDEHFLELMNNIFYNDDKLVLTDGVGFTQYYSQGKDKEVKRTYNFTVEPRDSASITKKGKLKEVLEVVFSGEFLFFLIILYCVLYTLFDLFLKLKQ